jgi:predicted RNA-binding protein associated with RNAse of E/G family
MKKKRLVYDTWTEITSKRYAHMNMDNEFFKGIAAVLYIDEVSSPQSWEFNGEKIVVCDAGMKWLQLIPLNETYAITAMMNSNNEIELWYIDMIADYGVDNDNIPYFHDLYLDLVVYPDGTIKIDDRDELEEAYKQKIITSDLYKLALETSEKLIKGILTDIPKLTELCVMCMSCIGGENESNRI